MKPPEGYFVVSEMNYLKMVDDQKGIAEVAKAKFMTIVQDERNPKKSKTKNNKIEQNYTPNTKITNGVISYYNDAVFFHDSETLKKLQEFRFGLNAKPLTQNELKWFISIDDIHDQIKIIRSNNIKVDSLLAFTSIKTFLISKFEKHLIMCELGPAKGKDRMSQITKELIKLKERLNYSTKEPKWDKQPFKFLLNESVKLFISIPIDQFDNWDKFDLDTLIDISRGKTEPFLKHLLEECFDYDENRMSKTKFLAVVFDLFRLILQDHNLMDKDTFDERKDLSYKSYDAYKAKRLKEIIYPKSTAKQIS